MGKAVERRPIVAYNLQQGSGTPRSGGKGAPKGALYIDDLNGVIYYNAGTPLASYWYPMDAIGNLWGFHDRFEDLDFLALSDVTAGNTRDASGVRVFGEGIAENDSGGVITSNGEGGGVMRLTTTDEIAHTVVLGTHPVFQPDQHGLVVFEAEVAQVSAITLRNVFFGLVGTSADVFLPPVTGSTLTATLVQDDLALMHYDVGYTDVDRWFTASNKSDADADQTAVDTDVNVAAAATFQLLRVEIDENANTRFFIDKALVSSESISLDVDEEFACVVGLESTSTAVKSMDVRRFDVWAHHS